MGLKIGLVTGEFPPMEGGVGAFTHELACALHDAGHEVHVITSRLARPKTEKRQVRQLLEPVAMPFGWLHPQVRRWRWSSVGVVADLVLRYELDVVNVQYQPAAYNMRSAAVNFLPWRLKGMVKTAVTFHDLRVPYLFPKAGPLRRWVVHFMARQAHGVIATNPADFAALKTAGIPHVREIPIGSNITVHQVSPAEIAAARTSLSLPEDGYLIGYFGFLNASKGADLLVRALAELDERVHLVFIGGRTGSSDTENNRTFLQKIDQLIDSLGLNGRVHWTGFMPEREVSVWLRAVDLMVMPYRDGASLRRGTLMAALAHGTPLLTTEPSVPTPALKHGESVWLSPVDDVNGLVLALRLLLADSGLRQRLGEGGTAVARAFAWDKIAAQTAEFFQFLLANT
ncbi:MAG: glycosyltransferase family 1 protein [Chloroflexi bacterium]|nr:MAG: glycosyltransferase family 1 protein [Chloroflexota bacterium]